MIDTVMFDLDGTLLHMRQDEFISVYFALLAADFARLGLDPERAVAAVWAGTKAMAENDGSMPNSRRYWDVFASRMELSGERLEEVEAATDDFYAGPFDEVRSVVTPSELPRRMVRQLAAKGFRVILATNPFFPLCGVATRLNWLGLTPDDFALVTSYSNSTYCKPNLGYYREVFTKLGLSPSQCLMAGNNAAEDMCVSELGAATYLVTDCLEGSDSPYVPDRSGTLADLERYLSAL
ncbi:MAG: HAD family hydrolase [Oscillospiraceae bacterium]|jgi:FMN phosphatase YigB (HAD superfamily)|nr:HAD family hydrolase [Oscillospiraceae bacterium]